MTDDKLNQLIDVAADAERHIIGLVLGYTLKGINTKLPSTAFENARVKKAEARWLLAENTLATYRLCTPALPS